jgi:primosomal protein N'
MQYLDVVPLRRVPWGLREFTYHVGDTGAQVGDLVWCRFGGHRTAAVAWQARERPPDGVAAQSLLSVERTGWTTTPQRSLFDYIANHYATPLPTLLYRYGVVPTTRHRETTDIPKLHLPVATTKLEGVALLEAPPTELIAAVGQLVATFSSNGPVLVLCPTRRDVTAVASAIGAVAYDLDDSRTERTATWSRILNNEVKIVVGTAAAAFLPFTSLGGVVVYREGDPAAKAVEARPLLHLRTVALGLGASYHCSVTVADWAPSPAAASWSGSVGRLVRQHSAAYAANVTLVTPSLLRSLEFTTTVSAANANNRLLVIVPRLGEGGYLRCADCRTVPVCPHCERSLPITSSAQLRCGYCGHIEPVPARCSKCGGTRLQARQSTVATVARLLRAMRDDGIVGEVSADSITNGDAAVVVSSTAALYQLDLTQYAIRIALDFDTLLHQPTLEAAPRAYRVARELAAAGPTTIETAEPNHPSLQNLDHWDRFVAVELAERRRYKLPPAVPQVKLSYDGSNRSVVERAGATMLYQLEQKGVRISGNYLAPGRSRIRRYRWVILVPGLEPPAGLDYSQWTADPDPIDLT